MMGISRALISTSWYLLASVKGLHAGCLVKTSSQVLTFANGESDSSRPISPPSSLLEPLDWLKSSLIARGLGRLHLLQIYVELTGHKGNHVRPGI